VITVLQAFGETKNDNSLPHIACISIMVAVLVAMVGIGVVKPDVGHAVAVQHHTSLVTGMGSVLNIILAYGMYCSFHIPVYPHLKNDLRAEIWTD